MNSRQTTILTHIASWTALLLIPLMSMGHGEGLQPRHVLVSVGVTLSFIAVFYPNYLWITPRYYNKGERQYFLLYNFVVIVAVAIAFHFWMNFCKALYPLEGKYAHGGSDDFHFVYILRSMFNLGIAVAVATALQLASRWRETEEARLAAEAARSEAELKTLRNQINPHFLLNTLNNIYALTAFDAARAQDAIQQLSKMLRHLLYECDQPLVPLKDEVDFIKNYIALMRIRLPETVEVTAHFDIGNAEKTVAPMLFISLVENAFKHGVSSTGRSFIRISLTVRADDIVCDISNSNHPKTAGDHSGHGIGMQQVQRRLDLSYPGQYRWEHGASEDGAVYHSCITIHLRDKATT